MKRHKLGACIAVPWAMKPLNSANTRFEVNKNGVYHLYIEHEILKGVSPEMLCWWFHNIKGSVSVNGTLVSRYQLWHPEDHILWKLEKPAADGGAGVGAKVRIVEMFARNSGHYINSVEEVAKLDETGIRLVRKMFGIRIFSLEHWFIPQAAGTRYKSHMTVGTDHFLMKYVFNYCIRRFIFSRETAQAWLRHNVEEVGNFEHFLPELFLARKNGETDDAPEQGSKYTGMAHILFASQMYI